jgi:hypothetical protein
MDVPNFLPTGKTVFKPGREGMIIKTADGDAAAGRRREGAGHISFSLLAVIAILNTI